MRYEAVAFDLFGTLIRLWPPERDRETMTRMSEVLGIPVDKLASKWLSTSDARMTGFFESYESCISSICSDLGVAASEKQIIIASEIRTKQTRQEMEPHEGAVEVLSELRTMGYRIGLVSNISMGAVRRFEESLLESLIDANVMSCVQGTKKPDPNIFLTACKLLKVLPERCLYVADGWDDELNGAAAVGMTPLLIRHPGSHFSSGARAWTGPTIE